MGAGTSNNNAGAAGSDRSRNFNESKSISEQQSSIRERVHALVGSGRINIAETLQRQARQAPLQRFFFILSHLQNDLFVRAHFQPDR